MVARDITDDWFNAIGVKLNYRTMVYYDGTGGDTFEINFEGGYINRADVKAHKIKNDDQTKVEMTLTFITDSRVKTSEVVPVGWTVLLYRDTPKATPLAQFIDGAIISAENLDRNAKQAVFCVAEMVDRFDNVNSNSEEALKQVYIAITTADTALERADTAITVSSAAKVTAEAASVSAAAAVVTADEATVVADNAYAVATGIEAKADAAVVTANTANSTANGIDAKATTALANSSAAVTTANAAASSATAAVTTANAAKATADGIDAKATEALATANTAQSTVNAAVTGKVNRAGDTLTGVLLLAGDATVPLAPITKRQFDVLNNDAFTASKVESTPWINATLQNGWSAASTGRAVYRKVLGVVNLHLNLVPGTVADGTVLFTLPVGYRPAYAVSMLTFAAAANAPIPARINVLPNGQVTCTQTAATNGITLMGSFTLQ